MSERADLARLQMIMEFISDIEAIVSRHGDSGQALSDVEGKHALMMCLQQIGEALGKIERQDWQEKLSSKQASAMRNIIAHNYLGVDLKIAKAAIDNVIPELKLAIDSLLGNT